MTAPEGAPASPASAAAAALLDALVTLGVRHLVVSPGSRSQALALAAAELERQGRVSLHVRIDERSAGFTALGIGRETRVPAAVICTSGTAVANLLPAALEAHHSGIPLLLLTADRPPGLRGVGANQTTAQPGIFGEAARFAVDAPVPAGGDEGAFVELAARAFVAAAGESVQGVAHLNLPFVEPLAGPLPEWFADGGGNPEALRIARALIPDPPAPVTLEQGPRTIVVAGEGAGEDAELIARQGGWPLVAEIVSGARFGRRVVQGARAALADPSLGGRVERAVVVGHPTLTREATGLLSRPDLEVVALRGTGVAFDLNGATRQADAVAVAPGEPDRAWLQAWAAFSRAHTTDLDTPAPDIAGLASYEPRERLGAVRAELAAVRTPLDRAQLVAGLWRATWPHDRLVFGSSRLVRVADDVLSGKRVRVHANRGLAGIDGTIATGLGVALALAAGGGPGVTRVLLGDLAFLHDVGSLLLPDAEARPRIQVVVGNDGGGTIFDGLEVAQAAGADAMTRVQYTPQSADIAQLAGAYGWGHVVATTRSALDQALTAPVDGPQIVEVPLAR
ncbi:2-succinyl-5-enolpyruvyl-6-hydroxy-3-cyclohexene-1-carboxylic-acid synthase [Microbacterium sp. ZXX196]|uniref:2-succinyl-5-enolpyruvyl-6-hydroxy-3- cyclohexene-1-carboxylic-acid synthase n=1 Tax=Microbacterium sp. ZXX196 TaxID=2609291 RepID=UPI0012B6D612|nr:2-succinyl-5-enolpyruvyl-6-hydroxy-3-cyclohexene-1-carboxylic-acid synthase [Microbacterium sp. ZXX196]MTE23319.1 2-succinyl-5-enolpyruvyl-6-hydroxy-3-cyclohexene-1-carboxylic-acid synthase [Microbacterium sp. ZXX196]